ncbi:MAG: hypothetical protein NC818_07595 [Candidatus Omnitrophica bacterium]|nr:hypothetical protein [Candidatus Omnitrophota bacterium]
MDNWADALPVTPPVAIPLSAYSVSNAVWEELTSSHITNGTFGQKLGKQPFIVDKSGFIVKK